MEIGNFIYKVDNLTFRYGYKLYLEKYVALKLIRVILMTQSGSFQVAE